MQKITPFLWFDNNAEEAANFYVSVFKNSKVSKVTRYGEAGPGAKGTAMTVEFELDGEEFIALNGGPHFKFTEAVSFSVDCKTQEEVDRLWETLSEGRREIEMRLAERQVRVVMADQSTVLGEMLGDKDPEKAKRVMEAMLQMDKIEIETLKRAYNNE